MKLYLLRHTEVTKSFHGICYGISDIGLSRKGQADAKAIIKKLENLDFDLCVSSNMRRTNYIADKIAKIKDIPLLYDERLRERNFGNWEAVSWDSIYKATGSEMDNMMYDIKGYRPGNIGETTFEVGLRTIAAINDLYRKYKNKTILIISHGGPISYTRVCAHNLGLDELLNQIPKVGEMVEVDINKKLKL